MSSILHVLMFAMIMHFLPAQCEHVPAPLSTVVLPEVMELILQSIKPTMSDILQAKLPASIGNCNDLDSLAPRPCKEIGDLVVHQSCEQKVRARWIGIINLAQVEILSYLPPVEDPHRWGIQIGLRFPELPLSLKVQACSPVIGCSTVLDNVGESCCGSDKLLQMVMYVTCHEDGYPFLRQPALADVSITPPMEVKVKGVKVKDITSMVESQLQEGLQQLLTQGLMQDLNSEIRKMIGDHIVCSRR